MSCLSFQDNIDNESSCDKAEIEHSEDDPKDREMNLDESYV